MFQIEVWKSQEYFVYFKIFKPISWGKRPAERRCRLIQRFPKRKGKEKAKKSEITDDDLLAMFE